MSEEIPVVKTVITDPIIVSVSKLGKKLHVWLVIASVVTKETSFGTIEGGSTGDAGMVKLYPNQENMPEVGKILEGSYELGEYFKAEEVNMFRTVKPV